MAKISLIAAMSENHVIGIENRLPWRLPKDWENFRKVTENKAFIMGRKSYEAEDKLVSDYKNVIISRKPNYPLSENEILAGSVEEALSILESEGEVFILGGAEIFNQCLHLADYLYLTIVHGNFEGDAFFPVINWANWELTKSVKHDIDDKHEYAFSLNEYKKVKH